MKLENFEFRDPGELIREVAERVPLTEDTAHAVLVHQPSRQQRIVDIRSLDTPARIDSWQEASSELRKVVETMSIPDLPGPPQHAVMTVVVRPGLCVFGPNESCWFLAWRYSNYRASTHSGDLILVTEHGWADFMTGFAGHLPVLAG